MTAVSAAVLGASVAVGLFLVVAGLLGAGRSSTGPSTALWKRSVDFLVGFDGRAPRRLLLGLVAAAAGFWYLRWPILSVAVPLAFVGIPALLSTPRNRDIELLQALDRWIRSLTATLPTGRSIADALRISTRGVPGAIADPVRRLVDRLDSRWATHDALLALAEDLDSPDADAALAALILAARRGGTGATATLAALSDWIQDRLRALRLIETERAKPRTVVRQVTGITLFVLVAGILFGREFFAPYGSSLGQLVLAGLIAAYAGSLLVLRRMVVPRKRERVLRRYEL